jgi:hypothetical protein
MIRKSVPIIDFNPFDGFFLDLDGVYADFDGRFFKLTGKWPYQVEKKQMWKIINADDRYFASLEMMEDAHHLWEYTKQFMPTFLTGLPSKQGGKEQKENWVAEKFGSEWKVIVLPKRDKQLHSGPNRVLIDDTIVNIQQWTEKGGHGVHHRGDVWETIDYIEELRRSYR